MQVFLSWSGERSKATAAALHDLLPTLLQPVTCWMSESDLPKGKPWFENLKKNLDSIVFAIVCTTPENCGSQWLLWESGFLSSTSKLGDRHVVPLAVGMAKGAIGGPLSIYQGADVTHDDMFRLIGNINMALDEGRRVPDAVLGRTFELIWPTLEKRLQAAVALESPQPPAKLREQPDQQDEMLALLRQQQREGADIKAMTEQIDLKLKLMSLQIRAIDRGAGFFSPMASALNADNIIRPESGALGLIGQQPNTTIALDELAKRADKSNEPK